MPITVPEEPLELHLRRKILLAYDNSEYSKAVFQYALDNIFVPNKDHVALATVVDEEQSMWLLAHNSRAQNAENMKRNRRLSLTEHSEASDILKPLSEDLASKGITSNFYILKGDPKVQLVKLAEHAHVDLVVVGTRGLGLIKRNLLGSVSEYVVRNCECSVLVVKQKPEKTDKPRSRPGSPTNSFSSTARRSLQAPISLFRTLTK
ncbi:adenine nucleotide alpha hydrolases-like protein [Gigaspora margarita]|uniref:Adenine nucleotide alpha hydrolases-like protein n=1 Tax=Gigaspora margarita TaxID=4874 RepID=A0A8H4APS0_GIGMA|nr:adenine nucleotide alpha hydrolases-like protein [Gigaspora margarita]